MSFTIWLSFFFTACVISVSPGSGAVLSMSHGLSYGVKNTTATILGLLLGIVLVLIIAGAGVGSILLASERAFQVVKTVGAVYLIYLGLMQWRAKPASTALTQHSEERSDKMAIPTWRKRFLTGFFTNATNPKGIIFMVAVLPQFIQQSAALLPQLVILGATMCCIDLVVMHSYAFAASRMQAWLGEARHVQRQNRFFGGVLMTIGAALFFVKRHVVA
jgi:homoserine/homoserine lactone efflux protein